MVGVGYVNPVKTRIPEIKPLPSGIEWEKAINAWSELASDEDCEYDDVVKFDASEISQP